MKLTDNIITYAEAHREEALDLLTTLAAIPAPSAHEEARAAFCLDWLKKNGADSAYIDDALNVIFPVGVTADNPLTVYMAHSDVVFPDTDPLPLEIRDGRILCPGVGDDTANVVMLLMAAKYVIENNLAPKDGGVLLIVNSAEEGLGNLKGSKKIIADFGARVKEFVTFDLYAREIVNRAVGSMRYRVEIDTAGGHSYNDFGNKNAIAHLASLVNDLYATEVPQMGKTTYNVGEIRGGTSVNTIAQHAEMLYEFRSDVRESLAIMEQKFSDAIDACRAKGVSVTVTLLGERPCSGEVDETAESALTARAALAVKECYGFDVTYNAGSTDCNVPLSVGIPSVCVGCILGGGAHTREEYIEADSILPGMKTAFAMILHHF